jgi:hypothetical protein
MVKCDGITHPSGRTKYKKLHILLMEEKIGREIKTQQGNMGEQVHHIDGDKNNNSLANLILCHDTRDHRNMHCQLEKIAYKLVQKNVIVFNTVTREYEINENRIN